MCQTARIVELRMSRMLRVLQKFKQNLQKNSKISEVYFYCQVLILGSETLKLLGCYLLYRKDIFSFKN